MAQGRGRWLMSAMLIFWVWSALMFMVRVWAKVNVKRWGSDDYVVTAAFVVSLMDIIATIWALQHGYGLRFASIAQSVQGDISRALFAEQQFYVAAMALCKISASLFLIRLAYPGRQVRPGYIMIAVSTIWGVASMLAVGLRGSLDNPWATLDGSSAMHIRWIAVEISGLLIEAALWALSFSLVRDIQINMQQRVIILSAFGVRLLLAPIMVVRLYYLAPQNNPDPTFTSIIPHITTEIALNFSVISASITSLRPFLRTFHLDYTVDSKGASKYGSRSGDHSRPRDSYYRLDPISVAARKTTTTRSQQQQERWEANATTSAVRSQRRDLDGAHGLGHGIGENISQDVLLQGRSNDLERARAGPQDRMVIQKTVDWTVQYEGAGSPYIVSAGG